jgi:DMSO/TMAO reductase YedYZ molybdopterin-dependent catalytic subunit
VTYISRGFHGRRAKEREDARLPPGQHPVEDFPVLSAGPTPRTSPDEWTFSIEGDQVERRTWSWEAFRALPSEEIRADIHCVTKWSKLETTWEGVSIDTLLENMNHDATHVMAHSEGDYTTNLPLEDLVDGKAWIAFAYDGQPLEAEHGGPARLLVPHLYFWKSAKWIRGLRLMDHDEPGFWESYGYHIYGDPWREQRYSGD